MGCELNIHFFKDLSKILSIVYRESSTVYVKALVQLDHPLIYRDMSQIRVSNREYKKHVYIKQREPL